ncbi:Hypothetical predicted protein [Cloeon dipterum]|uniref:Uncharacterized protein n=1 Tax=Cloeon dipterum TaxID=197152 RepID=A0A8S1D9F2_9INSE|nr:Hypothetical predicted protein [Cloeon dipterum]
MESGGKLGLALLSICLQIFTCSCSYITYQHRNLNSWEILIGANGKKKNFSTTSAAKCNCSVNDTVNTEQGFAYFTVNCNNGTLDGLTGACPQKLTISYEHGDVHRDSSTETLTATKTRDESCSSVIWIWLFSLSLVINVVLLFTLRNLVSTLKRENKDLSNKIKQTDNFNI